MVPSTRLAVALAVVGMMLIALPGVAQDNGLPPETLAQSVPIFAFQTQGNRQALVFTGSGSAQEQEPRVFVSGRDGTWRLIQLPDELHNTVWIWVGRATSGDDVWGITMGGTGVLQFVSSGNSGRNWKLRGSLPKVSKAAVLDSFSMNDEGHGSLILRLDEDSSPNAPRLGYSPVNPKNRRKAPANAMFLAGKPPPSPPLLGGPDRPLDNQQPF